MLFEFQIRTRRKIYSVIKKKNSLEIFFLSGFVSPFFFAIHSIHQGIRYVSVTVLFLLSLLNTQKWFRLGMAWYLLCKFIMRRPFNWHKPFTVYNWNQSMKICMVGLYFVPRVLFLIIHIFTIFHLKVVEYLWTENDEKLINVYEHIAFVIRLPKLIVTITIFINWLHYKMNILFDHYNGRQNYAKNLTRYQGRETAIKTALPLIFYGFISVNHRSIVEIYFMNTEHKTARLDSLIIQALKSY